MILIQRQQDGFLKHINKMILKQSVAFIARIVFFRKEDERNTMINFVALDFEFGLNMPERTSIVEIGLQRVINGQFEDAWETLVNPESDLDAYASDNIHHIYLSDVLFAPKFNEVWSEMVAFIGDLPVVVHGVKNERHAIITNCQAYNLDYVDLVYVDTLKLAQTYLPKLAKYNVNYLAHYFGIPLVADHSALSDAKVTAQIYLALAKQFNL